MIKSSYCKLSAFLFSFLIMGSLLNAQKTVLDENFNTSQGTSFTTGGAIESSIWNVTRNGSDFGAKIDEGILTLTNDATSVNNSNGWVLASIMTSSLAPNYKSTLNQNVGIVSWSFNMRNLRSGNNAFTGNNYGVAYILAGTDNTTSNTGVGYAVRFGYGNGETLRLIRYENGLSNQYSLLTSPNVGKNNVSIRIEYNPQTENWSIYTRQDPEGAFTDPSTGPALTLRETQNHSAEPWNLSGRTDLTKSGAFWYASTAANANAIFDNVKITVVVPEIISITPSSTTAGFGQFTLTVNGKNFKNGDQINWNGNLRTTTFITAGKLTTLIPATDIKNAGTANITVKRGAFTTNAVPFTILVPGTPTLILPNTTLANMETTQGTPSPAQSYTISANNLTTAVTLTAPDNFEISKSSAGPWDNTLTLEKQTGNAGGLLGTPVTIYARLTGAMAGVFSGNISHAATGAVTKNVSVSGRVMAIEPASSASNILFSNITSTSFKVDWTKGTGANRLLIVKKASAVDVLPTDGTTYFDSSTFGNGSDLGNGNFVVYKGNGSAVTVTGLDPSTNYHVSVIEFNGPAGAENYRSAHVPGNTTTLNNPVGLQLFAPDTSYKINFDQTVDGVNVDRFQGYGITPSPSMGQLDSDAWAFGGFAGGDLPFGGTSPDNSIYERGISNGNVNETGIYGFNVGTGTENYSLGIQPGGTDFNPGNITLKIQNQNATTMTSVNIGYKVYVYNDQAASTKIAFNYSSDQDGISGFSTADGSLNVVSPSSADLAPGWKAYYRVTTVTGLNIAKDKFFYIKWSGSLASGSGAQDEFAIDDIEVIANPGTNTVSFDGVAEDFVLQGNANLSGNLSVQNRLVFNGGKLAIRDNTLTIAGSVTNTTSNGLKGGATSKLVVRGIQNPTLSLDQTTPGVTNVFDSFSLIGANANTVTALNNFSVNDNLQVDAQQILDLGTNTLSGDLTSILNNGTIQTQNTTTTPFASGKTWSGSGVLNLNAASTAQTLVGGTYTNLTLSSPGGTTTAANVTVNGILNLPAANASATNGSLSTGIYTLTMGPDGINTGIGDVTGIIRRDVLGFNKLYTFGHPNTSISFPPNAPGGTLPSTMSIKLSIGSAVTWKPTPVLRSVDIIQTGGTLTKATIRQHYLDSELNGNTESKLVFWGKAFNATEFEQGRSSINTDMNWVEITNANVGQYFTGTFGQVTITLDQTEVAGVVWNGSVSDSWTTAGNWTPPAKPGEDSKVIIPQITIAGHSNPTLNPSEKIGSITIETGGVVNSTSTSELILTLGAGAWQNNGTFNPGNGTSNVTFNNIDATISGSTTFNNLRIASGAGIRPAEGNYMSIAGTLTNSGTMFTTLIPNTIEFVGTGQTIPAPGGESFGGYHNLIVSGTGATTFAPAISTLNVRGNLTLNQNVPFTGITVNLAGISNQTIGGTAAITFNDLIVNKETAAVLLAKDITVGGTLNLTKGNVVLGANNLTLGSNAVAGEPFTEYNMIVADGPGFVRRPFTSLGSYLFPIGELEGAPNYSPITVNITSAASFANAFIAVNNRDIKHPNNSSGENYLRHYWNVKQTGITGAKATITANYETLDINGPEDQIAAAQLTGPFNVKTNPWIKFAPFVLDSNTLIAENATLEDGQTSVFTGLKAGAFNVDVNGYGEFCIGSTATLEAVTNGGDGPFTYDWTNTSNTNTADTKVITVTNETIGSTNYKLTVRDANGFVASDNDNPVTIVPVSVGGTISANTQQICGGNNLVDLELSGSVGSILYWQKSTDPNFATFENLASDGTSLAGASISPIAEATYFRAVLKSGSCAEVFSEEAKIIKSTTWNGTVWSNLEPTSSSSIIFASSYTLSGTQKIEACSCEVSPGATLKIGTGTSMTLQNGIVNNGGTIIVESDANLIQINDEALNTGNVLVKRQLTFRVENERNEYNYLISPVVGSNLKTDLYRKENGMKVSAPFVLYHNEANNKFYNSSGAYIAGRSLAVKEPTANSGALSMAFFEGKPFNGKIVYNLVYSAPDLGNNLVGNPYPSNLDLNVLYTDNQNEIESTFQFWDNTANSIYVQQGSSYSGNAYAIFNAVAGERGTGLRAPGKVQQEVLVPRSPNNIVKVGQGFMVKAKGTGRILNYRNYARTGLSEGSVFYGKQGKEDRYFLQMTAPSGITSTTAMVYFANGNNLFGADDSGALDNSDLVYSIVQNEKVGINGRSSFVSTDAIPLGTQHFVTGNYIMALGDVEGIFANGQNIYLKDKQTNMITNLSEGDYSFSANAGDSTGRFEIVYEPELVLATGISLKEELTVYKDRGDFVIKAQTKKITMVELYDTGGRLIYMVQPNSTKVVIPADQLVNGVYVLRINQNGQISTKKIIR